MSVTFIDEKDGIKRFALTCGDVRVEVINYGGRIHSIKVPDKNGTPTEILCGYDDANGYRGDNPYFNAIIGRVGNRIGGGAFVLDGVRYELYKNDGVNALHGGKEGFDRKIWDAEIVGDELRLSYLSKDMEEGFPGNFKVVVIYSLDENGLHIRYDASTDKKTICNLTNHAYFNLNGDFSIPVYNLQVKINADHLTEITDALIPTGKLVAVTGRDLDFNNGGKLDRINGNDELVKRTGGYDFNYVLNAPSLEKPVATVISPLSGIAMDVFTDRPCMQLYTGNFLDTDGRAHYAKHTAFCMETQGYPNACNIPAFPSVELAPGQKFESETIYKFYVEK